MPCILNDNYFFCVLHYRRQDQLLNTINDRICGSHFKDVMKSNGLSHFCKKKRKCLILVHQRRATNLYT